MKTEQRKLQPWTHPSQKKNSPDTPGRINQVLLPPVEPSVYTSKDYVALCENLGVVQSMGAVGSSADNALAESFNATLKRELLAGAATFANQTAAYRAVFRWASRYNTRRRHSAIGNISPNTYENTRTATVTEAA